MTNNEQNHNPIVDPAYYAAVTAGIRSEAISLLGQGTVTAVIGYVAGRRTGTAQPAIITDIERANDLIFSPGCQNNLALYLTKAKKRSKSRARWPSWPRGAICAPWPAS
jgi:hypothetical protein